MSDPVRDLIVCRELTRVIWDAVRTDLDAEWQYSRLSDFIRDTHEHVDPETGEVTPPNFKYFAALLAVRADGVHFYVTVIVPEDYDALERGAQASLIKSVAMNAALTFNEFRLCSCQVDAPCEKHK
jgi:hypothetical protein